MSLRYTIRTVAAKTGLSAHTIRAWERRYGALSPDRSETNRRLYEDEDVERLTHLRMAVEAGHSIGQVAQLPLEDLRRFVIPVQSVSLPPSVPSSEAYAVAILKAAETAIENLDADGLNTLLINSGTSTGIPVLIENVIVPLTHTIGQRWKNGTLDISQEHLASAVLRTHLERVRSSLSISPNAPRILVTTPAGQLHELGASIVAIVATLQGWRVTYLGPNLPYHEIAGAAKRSQAKAVGLSLVYPLDDLQLNVELKLLRESVGPAMSIFVGGRAANAYASTLEEIGAEIIGDLEGFRTALDRIR